MAKLHNDKESLISILYIAQREKRNYIRNLNDVTISKIRQKKTMESKEINADGKAKHKIQASEKESDVSVGFIHPFTETTERDSRAFNPIDISIPFL